MLLAALFVPPSTYASRYRKYKPPPPMATLDVTVLRAADGKPLENVAVVFHPVRGTKDEGNMELKTNAEGKASLTIVPIGSEVLVQVIAPGYRTFGKKYDVPTSKKSITIKMLLPNQQYSVYKKSNSNTDAENNTPHTQMGHAAPADSPLLTPPQKKE
ncbi:MAG: carboxypeptidase-like regulatory domain-containing protein [Acidobacteriaceae bacterium]